MFSKLERIKSLKVTMNRDYLTQTKQENKKGF
jgi:hypothetical protein